MQSNAATVVGSAAYVAAVVAFIGWIGSLNVYPQATGMMWWAGTVAAVLTALHLLLRNPRPFSDEMRQRDRP